MKESVIQLLIILNCFAITFQVGSNITAMAGHTMTLIDDTRLLFIGGFSLENYFSETVFEYDTKNNRSETWSTKGTVPTGKNITGIQKLRICQ